MRFFGALFTTTSFGFDVLVPVFFAVVVAELFTWFDVLDCRDIHTTFCSVRLAVGAT